MRTSLKKILTIYIVLISSIQLTYGQDYVFNKEIKLKEASKISIDHFGNYYIISSSDILKYNKQHQFQYKYTEENLNENIYFDISDPFKPLVLNQDFYSLKVLDNRLGIINEIYLNEIYEGLIQVIISSSAQEYWVYDKQDNKLKSLNYDFEVLKESIAFQVLFDDFSDPKKIIIENEKLYLLDNFGFKTFDLFGNYISSHKVENINDFQVINGEIIYLSEQALNSYNAKTLSLKKLPLNFNENEIIETKILNNVLLILEEKALKIFIKK